MEKIEKLPLFGYRGNAYFFSVYPLQDEYPAGGGVYFYAKRVPAPNAVYTVILIGQTTSFKNINQPQLCNCIQSFGANTVCLMPVEKEEERLFIIKELAERYRPECNLVANN